MDTNIIINGVVIQSEWVEAIERRMRAESFSISRLIEAAMEAGCNVNEDVDLSIMCVNCWLGLGKITQIEYGHWRIATPAETEAHNRKMKGGVV